MRTTKATQHLGVKLVAVRVPPASSPKPAPSSSTEEGAPKAPLRWILPTRTAAKLHLKLGAVDDRGRVIPPCRSRPYVFGYREGEGLAGALATRAKWCTECARFARERGHDLEAELEMSRLPAASA